MTDRQPLDPLVQLSRDGMPVVLVNTLGIEAELPSVGTDNYQGALTAVNHLLQLGHQRIACVQGMATAAGCQLVAACDLAVAAETASFATPGVKIGLFCTTPMVPLVRAIAPKARNETARLIRTQDIRWP